MNTNLDALCTCDGPRCTMTFDDDRHGTYAGYVNGCRCQGCHRGRRFYQAKSSGHLLPEGDPRHGRLIGYAHGCLCIECQLAKESALERAPYDLDDEQIAPERFAYMMAPVLSSVEADALHRLVKRTYVDENGCWICTMRPTARYSHVEADGVALAAHRFTLGCYLGLSYAETFEQGEATLHACDVGHCVNPAHLTFGTQMENVRDMMDKGRARDCTRVTTHCPNGHYIAEANVSLAHLRCQSGVTCLLCQRVRAYIGASRKRGVTVTWDEAMTYQLAKYPEVAAIAMTPKDGAEVFTIEQAREFYGLDRELVSA